MKIICKDGYARDNIADRLVAENIQNSKEADIMLKALLEAGEDDESQWYELVLDEYRLWQGMEDLV